MFFLILQFDWLMGDHGIWFQQCYTPMINTPTRIFFAWRTRIWTTNFKFWTTFWVLAFLIWSLKFAIFFHNQQIHQETKKIIAQKLRYSSKIYSCLFIVKSHRQDFYGLKFIPSTRFLRSEVLRGNVTSSPPFQWKDSHFMYSTKISINYWSLITKYNLW